MPAPLRRLAEIVTGTPPPALTAAWDAMVETIEAQQRRLEALEQLPRSSTGFFARTPEDGIDAAADVDTPSSAICTLRIFDGETFHDGGPVEVWNKARGATGAIPGGIDIGIDVRDHRFFATWQDCEDA